MEPQDTQRPDISIDHPWIWDKSSGKDPSQKQPFRTTEKDWEQTLQMQRAQNDIPAWERGLLLQSDVYYMLLALKKLKKYQYLSW